MKKFVLAIIQIPITLNVIVLDTLSKYNETRSLLITDGLFWLNGNSRFPVDDEVHSTFF